MSRRLLWSLCLLIAWMQSFSAGMQGVCMAQTGEEEDAAANETPLANEDAFPIAATAPLKRVVLYSSGVGHMEHGGVVDGNARQQIRFSGHDVDDVLKSLVFSDAGGGRVKGVEYQPAPDEETIAANNLGQPLTLAQMLQQMRGEQISLIHNDMEVFGVIYSVENRQQGASTVETLNVMTDDGLQSHALSELTNIQFLNEALRVELQKAMSGVAKSREASQKQLDLFFEGEGTRQVAFAYVVDAPVWRMSYRLDIRPDSMELQGWAHVNNVTGNDWEGVDLELRSGEPNTFHAELFAPLVAERPSVGLSIFGFPARINLISQWFGMEPPPRFADGQKKGGGGFGGGGFGGGLGGGAGGLGGGGFGGGGLVNGEPEGEAKERKPLDMTKGFASAAEEGRALQQVRFHIDHPVELQSGKSVLLPVLSLQLPSKSFSLIVDQGSNAELVANRVVELTNNTASAFVPGPVSILESGVFAGDSALERVPLQETSRLAYGPDLALKTTKRESPVVDKIVKIDLSKEKLVIDHRLTYEVIVNIQNGDSEPRSVVYEFLPGKRENTEFQIVDGDAIETKDGALVYRADVPGLSSKDITIPLVNTYAFEQPLISVSAEIIKGWLQLDAEISEATRSKLQSFVNIQREYDVSQSRIDGLKTEREGLIAEQQRTRSNIEALRGDKESADFIAALKDQEEGIRSLTKQITEQERVSQGLLARRRELIASP